MLRPLTISFLLFPCFALASATLLGLEGTHRTFSAKTLGAGKLSIGITGNGSYDNDRLEDGSVVGYDVDYDYENGVAVDSARGTTYIDEIFDLTARLYVSMGLTNYFDLSVSLPIYSDWISGTAVDMNSDLENANSMGIGDVEIAGKLQYPPYEHDPVFDMAFMGILTLPTGDKDNGFIPKQIWYIPKETSGTNFYTAGSPTLTLLMLTTLDFREINRDIRVQWHFNVGMLATSDSDLDNAFLLSTSIVWHPSNDIFGLFLEFSGQSRMEKFTDGFNLGDDPLYLTPGFILEAENGFSLSLGMDLGLTQGSELSEIRIDNDPGPSSDNLCENCTGDGSYSSYKVRPVAPWGVSATLSWSGFLIPQDKDHDGVVDNMDACSTEPEDIDKFQDNDGCPDNDNDEDGLSDVEDKCPMEPEDLDNFQDDDGCPDLDNDNDHILDKKDKCPNAAEDYNGYQDEDGCPDAQLDSDKDGVPDYMDKCIKDPEDPDGFQDNDGCPDNDNDNDKIPDNLDRCPNAAEIINGFEDNDGCPDQKAAEPIIIEKIIEKRDTVLQVKKDTIIQKDTVVMEKIIEKKATVVLYGVNFATGSAELTPESFAKLDEVANALKRAPGVVLEIRGHTDDRGSAKLNSRLSQQRADAVCRYLVSQGVQSNQLRATGYGSKMPIASNKTAAGREKNRRIEMYRIE